MKVYFNNILIYEFPNESVVSKIYEREKSNSSDILETIFEELKDKIKAIESKINVLKDYNTKLWFLTAYSNYTKHRDTLDGTYNNIDLNSEIEFLDSLNEYSYIIKFLHNIHIKYGNINLE